MLCFYIISDPEIAKCLWICLRSQITLFLSAFLFTLYIKNWWLHYFKVWNILKRTPSYNDHLTLLSDYAVQTEKQSTALLEYCLNCTSTCVFSTFVGREKIPSRTSCWFLVPFLHLSSVWGQRHEAAFFPAPWTALSAPPSRSPLPEPRSSGPGLILLSDHSLTIGNWLLKYYRRSPERQLVQKVCSLWVGSLVCSMLNRVPQSWQTICLLPDFASTFW